MELKKIHSFLRKNNFIENNREGSFSKSVDGVIKKYRFKDNGIFAEVKRNDNEDFQLIAFGDIRDTFINEKGQISGLRRAVPEYSKELIKERNAQI